MDRNKLKYFSRILKVVIILTSFIGISSIILEYGFRVKATEAHLLHYISIGVVIIFFLYHIIQFSIAEDRQDYLRSHKIESLFLVLIIVEVILANFNFSLVAQLGVVFHLKDVTFLYVMFAQMIIVIGLILGGLRYNRSILQSKIHPSRLFVLSFIVTIVIGALLLMLPASTVEGSINVVDAFFTSTSAVCVTGLITVDTATYFTMFGKTVILGLFQIGGLGLMTFTTFFALFLAGGMGIRERIMLHDLLDEENLGAIAKVLSFLTLTTFTIELIGAALLFSSVYSGYANPLEAVFPSIFHSISAFCNAGFSVFSNNLMDSTVQSNYTYTTVIALLIILGGIGFPTIISFSKLNRSSARKFKLPLQSRIVVLVTLGLIFVGTVGVYLFEYNHSLSGLDTFGKLHGAFFQSVTARTAGFNTVNIGLFSTPTTLLFLLLMFIGASPGGTGGGLKTTTFALIFFAIVSTLREEKNVVIGNRTISRDVVLRALLKAFISICIISTGIFLLTLTEKTKLIDLSFEAFSAFGTVGLSRGITSGLSQWGKVIIILLMFIGRVGPLAFIFSILKTKKPAGYEYPSENISIL